MFPVSDSYAKNKEIRGLSDCINLTSDDPQEHDCVSAIMPVLGIVKDTIPDLRIIIFLVNAIGLSS